MVSVCGDEASGRPAYTRSGPVPRRTSGNPPDDADGHDGKQAPFHSNMRIRGSLSPARDRPADGLEFVAPLERAAQSHLVGIPVSYTHLTLPTILLV